MSLPIDQAIAAAQARTAIQRANNAENVEMAAAVLAGLATAFSVGVVLAILAAHNPVVGVKLITIIGIAVGLWLTSAWVATLSLKIRNSTPIDAKSAQRLLLGFTPPAGVIEELLDLHRSVRGETVGTFVCASHCRDHGVAVAHPCPTYLVASQARDAALT